MKLPAGKIEGVCSNDESRLVLNNVHLNVEKKRLEASDGKMAVMIGVEPEDGDTSGLVSVDVFKAARKAKSGVKLNGNATLDNSATMPRATAEGIFPDVGAVIPGFYKPELTHTVCLDAEKLLALAHTLNDPKGRCSGAVRLWVNSKDGCIVVKGWFNTDRDIGLLMPINSKNS